MKVKGRGRQPPQPRLTRLKELASEPRLLAGAWFATTALFTFGPERQSETRQHRRQKSFIDLSTRLCGVNRSFKTTYLRNSIFRVYQEQQFPLPLTSRSPAKYDNLRIKL